MSDRIQRRRGWAGTGMLADAEFVEQLEQRRAVHERATRGKPARSFADILDEKLHGQSEQAPAEAPAKGAIEPHMGLSPGQPAALAVSGKGRRAGRVIVKG